MPWRGKEMSHALPLTVPKQHTLVDCWVYGTKKEMYKKEIMYLMYK